MSFEGNYYEACKRIGVLEQQLADMTADYHRWHQAYCDAKYPESVPLSWQQTAEALKVAQAALIKVQQWDCLNPPRPELLADLPWLKRLVDEALTQSDAGAEPKCPKGNKCGNAYHCADHDICAADAPRKA